MGKIFFGNHLEQALFQDNKDYVVVHSLDGFDEISLTADVQYYSSRGEYIVSSEDFGMTTLTQESLFSGETLDEAIDIFLNVIKYKGSKSQTDAVVANAAAGIQCFEKDKTLKECVAIANETLASCKAEMLLKNLIKQQ